MQTTQNEFQKIGVIKDAHSLKGEVFVRLFAGQADWLDQVDELKITLKSGEAKNCVIEACREHKDGLIIKFAGVNDRTEAETFKGSSVEIPVEVLVAEEGEALYLREVLGFQIWDQTGKLLGSVKDFATNGRQDILVVAGEDNDEILIPFIKEFVTKMDMTGKRIDMDLPAGLVEVNKKAASSIGSSKDDE